VPSRGGLLRATLPIGCDGKGHGSSSLFVNSNGAFGVTIQVVALPEDNGSLGTFGKLNNEKEETQDQIVLANETCPFVVVGDEPKKLTS
jgi:hypothetical protein